MVQANVCHYSQRTNVCLENHFDGCAFSAIVHMFSTDPSSSGLHIRRNGRFEKIGTPGVGDMVLISGDRFLHRSCTVKGDNERLVIVFFLEYSNPKDAKRAAQAVVGGDQSASSAAPSFKSSSSSSQSRVGAQEKKTPSEKETMRINSSPEQQHLVSKRTAVGGKVAATGRAAGAARRGQRRRQELEETNASTAPQPLVVSSRDEKASQQRLAGGKRGAASAIRNRSKMSTRMVKRMVRSRQSNEGNDTGSSRGGCSSSSSGSSSSSSSIESLGDSEYVVSGTGFEYYCIPFHECKKAQDPKRKRNTKGGTVLMGGGSDVDAAFKWQLSRADGGDFLVLRESGTDAYNEYIYAFGGARTVSTLILNSRDAGDDPSVLRYVQEAEAIFFAGGDQSKYVDRIAGTALEAELEASRMVRNVSIGGTSAGCAIQGDYIYTGQYGSAVSSEALGNPYGEFINGSLVPRMTFVDDQLRRQIVVTDTHFKVRDRMGRLVVFLARVQNKYDGYIPYDTDVRGIGVDQETALLIGNDGVATVVGDGTAYMCTLKGSDDERVCSTLEPLTIGNAVTCERLAGRSFDDPEAKDLDTFDLNVWKGSGLTYTFKVEDGEIRDGNPYGKDDLLKESDFMEKNV
mmetsp:Transcript_27597/g.38529  ORF Transcript_27597/g.38529 Transcript_27597/m.38529 type:complete len:629 (-) Transcript_27597:221-2107(-)